MESANPNADTPKTCSGGCGFFGSAPLNYYCSVCFKKVHGEEEFKRRTEVTPAETPSPAAKEEIKDEEKADHMEVDAKPAEQAPAEAPAKAEVKEVEQPPAEPVKKGPTRCASCCKKVGLTGFVCRCGGTFCGVHRYSDKHECSFDYKQAGRDQLSKANPVVEAAKLEKI
uniref:AN1-type domain-containing protein n=2 Tax=Hemiselmis andersenii TaxID=464988 RepID=A0A6U4Z1J7_HEMAN|mmetsp:Transcript_36199/g.84824  ORF Transcript_36199/g.84824 Transcript_36199/m.84824 type:complete len:170 (-) Transcript_36199:40-549(-)